MNNPLGIHYFSLRYKKHEVLILGLHLLIKMTEMHYKS